VNPKLYFNRKSSAPSSPLQPLLWLLFFGSGCSALIYEIIWMQTLQLVVGLTTPSLGILLVPFMRQSRFYLRWQISSRRFMNLICLISLIVSGLALVWIIPGIPWGVVAYGRYMATFGSRLVPGITPEKNLLPGFGNQVYCIYMGEGLNGSVAVTQWKSGVRTFHAAGKAQASNGAHDMRLQRMLGHLPALIHSNPGSVLTVACGAGVTAGAFVAHPDVKRLVICEIESLVPRQIAPFFENENHAVMKDPRTEVIIDDGRHFIRTTKEKFDIITSDPIDPWVKGCAALNTVEYYQLCKSRLKPDGIMALWMPFYECDLVTARSMIASFVEAFPHSILWLNNADDEGYDAVLMGQVQPFQINLDSIFDRLKQQDYGLVKKSLEDGGFPSILSLLSTFAAQAGDLKDWLRGAPINSDRNLRLQYLAGFSYNNFIGSEIVDDIRRFYRFPNDIFIGSTQRLQMLKLAFDKDKLRKTLE